MTRATPGSLRSISVSIRRELRRLAAIFLFCLIALGAAACDLSIHRDSGGFSERDRADFMNGCLATGGGAREYCECSFEQIRKSLSVDELNAFTKAENGKSKVSAKTVETFAEIEFSCSRSTLSAAEKKRNVYPEPIRGNLIKSCKQSAPGRDEACRCVIRQLEKTLPLKELIVADTKIRVSQVANPKTMKKIGAASQVCF